jgi:hypothetical protein
MGGILRGLHAAAPNIAAQISTRATVDLIGIAI